MSYVRRSLKLGFEVRFGIAAMMTAAALGAAGCGDDQPRGAGEGAGEGNVGQVSFGNGAPSNGGGRRDRTPRLLSPLSGSRSDSRQPVFRWTPTDGGTLQICDDRACAHVLATAAGDRGSAQPDLALPAGVLFWRVASVRGTSAVWEIVIPSREAGLTTAFATLPDYNGDGFADIAIGGTGAAAGSVGLVFGAPFPSFGTVDATIVGPPGAGRAVAPVGDVDGDGFVDLGVAAAGTPGSVAIYRGSPTGPVFACNLSPGPVTADFGANLASAGDVDGDGYGDVLVGGREVAQVFRGGPAGAGCQATAAVSLAPPAGADATLAQGWADVDANGAPDVFVGGALYLGDGTGGFARFDAFNAGPFGSFAGDVDGDGFPDLASGQVWFGSPIGLDVNRFPFVMAGNFMSGSAGDIDGDGYGDVLSTITPLAGTRERERVYFGAPGACGDTDCRRFSPIVIPGHDNAGGNLRAAIAGAGDITGDGTDDLVVSTPDSGQVYILLGSAAGLRPFTFRTYTGPAGFGAALATVFGSAQGAQ